MHVPTYKGDTCTICDPDNDADCGWEEKEVYMPIDMNTYFIGYSAESGGNMNVVGITALSMDAALTKWALQFSDLYVHARTIFKYQPYSTITKVYKVMQEHTITTVTEYRVQY